MTNSLPKTPRVGFLKLQPSSPDNLNEMNAKEIAETFYGKTDADFLTERPEIVEEGPFNLDE